MLANRSFAALQFGLRLVSSQPTFASFFVFGAFRVIESLVCLRHDISTLIMEYLSWYVSVNLTSWNFMLQSRGILAPCSAFLSHRHLQYVQRLSSALYSSQFVATDSKRGDF